MKIVGGALVIVAMLGGASTGLCGKPLPPCDDLHISDAQLDAAIANAQKKLAAEGEPIDLFSLYQEAGAQLGCRLDDDEGGEGHHTKK